MDLKFIQKYQTNSESDWMVKNEDIIRKLFDRYIEESWVQYRLRTNNEDAYCFKEWLLKETL